MTTYAGFWLRFVAFIIDTIIVYVIQAFVFVPFLGFLGLSIAVRSQDYENMSDAEVVGLVGMIIATMGIAALISSALGILYGAFMESSKYQATVGKLALGLRVTDIDGQKLDFVKALLRNLGKLLSTCIFLIGYLMAAFTEKSQALHDMLASTLVVKREI